MTTVSAEGLAFGLIGESAFVVYHRFTDAAWRAYIDSCCDLLVTHGPQTIRTNLIVGSQRVPTAAQRAAFVQRVKHMPQRVAIVSDSVLERGTLNAMSFLTRVPLDVKPFAPRSFDAALTYLGEKAAFDRVAMAAEVRRLAVHVGLPWCP